MVRAKTLLTCLLLCWFCSKVCAQTEYPSTQYQGFGQFESSNDSANTPAENSGDARNSRDYDSMSPDSWSVPPVQRGTFRETESNTGSPQPSAPTPSVPDLGTKSPFASSSFSRSTGASSAAPGIQNDVSPMSSQVIPSGNLTRYPLVGGAKTESQSGTPMHAGEEFESVDAWYGSGGNDGPLSSVVELHTFDSTAPDYRPDLGHRVAAPTYRSLDGVDHGRAFDFETKKQEYPKIGEILATGRYFGSASVLYLKPAFQGNTAIAIQAPGLGESIPFDFDYESAPEFRFGFESKYGPGIELNYWQYDETSNTTSFTSDGTEAGTSSTWMSGVNQWSRLTAMNGGERLDAAHAIDAEVFGASFFKEMKFKISRLNGMFGFQYSSIVQSMTSTLTSGGAEVGRLTSYSDLNAFGPKFAMEYYRPMGHTKLEFFTSIGGSVLFGHRDQFVSNTTTGEFDRLGADEFVTTIDFLAGIQYKKMVAENRAFYARLGLNYETWIGGGTAVDPQGDFGLRGFSFGVGYNR